MLMVLYSLFAYSIAVVCQAPNSTSPWIDAFLILCMTIFFAEIALNIICRPRPPWFLLVLDLIATISIVVDLSWLANALNLENSNGSRTSSAALVSARAGRIVRLVRLLRLLRTISLLSALAKRALQHRKTYDFNHMASHGTDHNTTVSSSSYINIHVDTTIDGSNGAMDIHDAQSEKKKRMRAGFLFLRKRKNGRTSSSSTTLRSGVDNTSYAQKRSDPDAHILGGDNDNDGDNDDHDDIASTNTKKAIGHTSPPHRHHPPSRYQSTPSNASTPSNIGSKLTDALIMQVALIVIVTVIATALLLSWGVEPSPFDSYVSYLESISMQNMSTIEPAVLEMRHFAERYIPRQIPLTVRVGNYTWDWVDQHGGYPRRASGTAVFESDSYSYSRDEYSKYSNATTWNHATSNSTHSSSSTGLHNNSALVFMEVDVSKENSRDALMDILIVLTVLVILLVFVACINITIYKVSL